MKNLNNKKEDDCAKNIGYWFDVGSLSCRCSACGCKSDKEYTICPKCGTIMNVLLEKEV